jgi:hypothetical protein
MKGILGPWLRSKKDEVPEAAQADPESSPATTSSPVFIGGTGRSGTTAFARMLGLHPEIFVLRWETQLIVAPDGLLELLQRLHEPRHLKAFETGLRGRWFQRTINQGLPNEYSAGLCDDLTIEEVENALQILKDGLQSGQPTDERAALAATFVDSLFSPAMRRAGARRWAEKTPRNLLFMTELLAVFPRMKFINVVRDGRDVVSSMLQHGFWPVAPSPEHPETQRFSGPMTFEKAVDYWVAWMEIGRSQAALMPNGSYAEIRLEDIVANPREAFDNILTFIDVPFSADPLEFDLSRSHIGRWEKDLSHEQVEWMMQRAGSMLAECGYV